MTTGSEGTNGGINFQTSHQPSSIDYDALNYLSQHESTMRELGKPLVLEEIGLARDGWTASGKFDPAATTTHRDRYFQTVFETVEAEAFAQ